MIGSKFVLLPMRVIGVLIGYFTLHSEMEMAGTVPVVRLPYRPLGFVPSIFIAKMEQHLSLNARWFLKCITSFLRLRKFVYIQSRFIGQMQLYNLPMEQDF